MPDSRPSRPPRIAVLGFDLESNRFAPTTVRADFERHGYFVGPAIDRAARAEPAGIHGCIRDRKNERHIGKMSQFGRTKLPLRNGIAHDPLKLHVIMLRYVALKQHAAHDNLGLINY